MSNPIGFDKLFDAGSFDAGTKKIAEYIERITDEITKAEIAADDLTKVMGKQLKAEIAQLSSASKMLSKDMQVMAQKMNDFKTTTSNTKKVLSDYERENEKLRKELEKLKTAQQDVGKETTKAGTSFKGAAQAMLGLASGAALVYSGIRVLREQLILAVKSTIAFEKAMKEVQAISRATDTELTSLTKNANKLGATTEKLAVDVANVQKEMAKLGLTASEIIVSTKAIVDLSTATGEDLVSSAVVATSTLRAFGLQANEMTRVVDVMAGSFVRSGLDLEKFRESMKLVAPIARAVNVNIETTTAMLSKLADAGLSGSLAGTALRNLMSSMADPTEDLSKRLGGAVNSSEDLVQAFLKLKREGVDLAEAVQLVDVRARPAFFTLVNQAEAVEALAVEYKYLRDEASEIAKQMRDTLANDIDIASSAFDSLRRNIVENFSPAMRQGTQDITQMIEGFRYLLVAIQDYDDAIANNTQQAGILRQSWDWITSPFFGEYGLFTLLEKDYRSLMGVVTESNNINKAEEQFKGLNVVLEQVSTATSKVTKDYDVFTQANTILSKGLEDTSEGVKQLREEFPELSGEVANNREFLILLRSDMGKNIEATRSYITTLEDEKVGLKNLITELEGYRDTVGIGKEQTDQLEKAKQRLILVDSTLIKLTDKMKGIVTDLNTLSKTSNDLILERIELTEKLMKVNADLTKEQAKTAEMVAQNNLDEEESLKMKLPLLEKLKNAKINSANQVLKAELDAIKAISAEELSEPEKIVKRKIAYEKFTQAKIAIDKDYVKQYEKITEQIITIEDEMFKEVIDFHYEGIKKKEEAKTAESKLQGDINKDLEKFASEAFKKDQKFAEQQQENLNKYNDEELKKLKDKEDKKQAIIQLSAKALSDITTSLFDNRQIQRDIELEAIKNWEEEQTRLAGDNEQEKLRIKEESERRQREIKIKQAEDNKKEAIFQIFLDTAKAVMALAAQGNLAAAIVAGALGAAQIAMVTARPIPQFAKGTDDSPEGFAEVGERGRELIRDGKTGKWAITPNSSTVTYLTKHSQVITNAETERILAQDHNNKADNYLSNSIKQLKPQQIDYSKIGQEVGKHISKIPVNVTNFDQDGVTKFVMGRSSKITRLNKRY